MPLRGPGGAPPRGRRSPPRGPVPCGVCPAAWPAGRGGQVLQPLGSGGPGCVGCAGTAAGGRPARAARGAAPRSVPGGAVQPLASAARALAAGWAGRAGRGARGAGGEAGPWRDTEVPEAVSCARWSWGSGVPVRCGGGACGVGAWSGGAEGGEAGEVAAQRTRCPLQCPTRGCRRRLPASAALPLSAAPDPWR
jgi:hypothetical protein